MSGQAIACAECLRQLGRAGLLLERITAVIVIVDGESRCLDHAGKATPEAAP